MGLRNFNTIYWISNTYSIGIPTSITSDGIAQ